MSKWLESTNPSIAPPVIQSMLYKPKKVRKKEAAETKMSGKLPKNRFSMTYNTFKGKVQNKIGCPNSDRVGVGSSTSAAKPLSSEKKEASPR